jgi:hypothetical protein
VASKLWSLKGEVENKMTISYYSMSLMVLLYKNVVGDRDEKTP